MKLADEWLCFWGMCPLYGYFKSSPPMSGATVGEYVLYKEATSRIGQ